MDKGLAIEVAKDVVMVMANPEEVLFERIWQAIKHWDIDNGKPIPGTDITGYAGITGDDIRTIIRAIREPNGQ